MSEKRVIITGATGMVGGCALRICLENPDVSRVTVIGRSPTGIDDGRLYEVILNDFTDYSASASPPRTWPGQLSMPACTEPVKTETRFWKTRTYDP